MREIKKGKKREKIEGEENWIGILWGLLLKLIKRIVLNKHQQQLMHAH